MCGPLAVYFWTGGGCDHSRNCHPDRMVAVVSRPGGLTLPGRFVIRGLIPGGGSGLE